MRYIHSQKRQDRCERNRKCVLNLGDLSCRKRIKKEIMYSKLTSHASGKTRTHELDKTRYRPKDILFRAVASAALAGIAAVRLDLQVGILAFCADRLVMLYTDGLRFLIHENW
jgi:hypothetical protein